MERISQISLFKRFVQHRRNGVPRFRGWTVGGVHIVFAVPASTEKELQTVASNSCFSRLSGHRGRTGDDGSCRAFDPQCRIRCDQHDEQPGPPRILQTVTRLEMHEHRADDYPHGRRCKQQQELFGPETNYRVISVLSRVRTGELWF